MFVKSTYSVMCSSKLFIVKTIIWMYFDWLTYFCIERYLGCFQFGTDMNSTALLILIHIFEWTIMTLLCTYLEEPTRVYILSCHRYHQRAFQKEVLIILSLVHTCYLQSLSFSQSNGYVSHCYFFLYVFFNFWFGANFGLCKKFKNEWKELQYFLHPDSLNVKYVCLCLYLYLYMGFLGGSDSKESACNAGDPGSIPGEERIAPHSSILPWNIPWTEETSGLQSMRSQRVGHDWATKYTHKHIHTHTHTHTIQE